MDRSTYKTVATSRGFSYSYYASPAKGQKGTILFLHGFPEYATMWADQIKALEALGYNCIAPDLLGYGTSSQPTDAESYNSEGLSQDVAEILDAEGETSVIVVGHDWGAYLAGRFVNWQSSRVRGLILTSVAYRPADELQLDVVNAAMEKVLGYEPFGYWKFFTQPGAAAVIEDKIESFFSLLFSSNPEIWKVRSCARKPEGIPWLTVDIDRFYAYRQGPGVACTGPPCRRSIIHDARDQGRSHPQMEGRRLRRQAGLVPCDDGKQALEPREEDIVFSA